MATSRTGTAKWKALASTAKRRAQRNGQTRCPLCGELLNYKVGRTPHSAEADHINEFASGGKDVLSNIRIICRNCNQSRGGKLGASRRKKRRRRRVSVVPAQVEHSDLF